MPVEIAVFAIGVREFLVVLLLADGYCKFVFSGYDRRLLLLMLRLPEGLCLKLELPLLRRIELLVFGDGIAARWATVCASCSCWTLPWLAL